MHAADVRITSTSLAVLWLVLPLVAADDDRWDPRFGSVAEGGSQGPGEGPQLIVFRGKLYRSGSTVSCWDGATWHVVGKPKGDTWHLVASTNQLFVAGAFTSMSGVAARNVATWDGTNWNALDAQNASALGGRISAAALSPQGTLYISSQPLDYQSAAQSTIWSWTGRKWERVGDELRIGSTCKVEKIAAGRSNIFAVVYYEAPDVEHGYGERLVELADGKWRPFRQQPVHYGIHCIAVGDDDRPVVGGELYMNRSLTNLARWNGKAWETIGGGIQGYPLALAFDHDDLIVAGKFSGAGDVASRGLARWNGTNWQGFASGFSGGGTMYATTVKECIAIDMTCVGSIALDGERMFVSGSFTRAGNSGATGLAMWNGTEWRSLNSATQQGVNGKVSSLVAIDTNLFAVGEFTGVGGLATDGVARWDGERWQNLGGGFRTDSRSCATTDGTNLFVTSAAPDAHVFEWNHAMWKPHGSTGTDWARGLAVRGGQMLTGGYGIYQITDGGYAELPGSAQMRGASIDAIAFGRDGVVFVGGNFQRRLTMPASQRRTSHFNAPPRGSPESESFSPFHQTSNFAVWNGSTWLDTLGGVGEFPDRVSVIVRQGLYVFVGGVFETAGREPVHSLARWDGKAWHDVGGGVTGDAQYRGGVSAIAFHGNDI